MVTGARKTVFVVDDDPELGVLITPLLETEHHVRFYRDPLAALEGLAEGPAPDLLLFDVAMFKAVDLLARVRKALKG